MTNILRYTPPSDSATFKARDIALRGNMGSANFQQRGTGKIGLTRREIVRQVRLARPETLKIKPRIANVRKTKNGFHVVGLGLLPVSLGELKTKLRVGQGDFHGCTAYRVGGLVFPLFGKEGAK